MTLHDDYVIVSKEFLSAQMSGSALRLGCWLMCEPNGWATQSEMAVELGMSPTTVAKAIRELYALGYLTIEAMPGTRHREYTISDLAVSR